MRAGANEFFVWPIGHGGPPNAMEHGVHAALTKTSERLQAASPTARRSSRVLTFFGTKGGVGTTTLAVNCATELARLTKQPTLIVDLNPFIGEVGLFLGVRPRFTVLDALDSVDRLDEVFLKKLVATHKTGLDIIAGSEQLDRPNADDSPRVKQLLRILRQSYPFIVVDAGRLTNASAGTAMGAADTTFAPSRQDPTPSPRSRDDRKAPGDARERAGGGQSAHSRRDPTADPRTGRVRRDDSGPGSGGGQAILGLLIWNDLSTPSVIFVSPPSRGTSCQWRSSGFCDG